VSLNEAVRKKEMEEADKKKAGSSMSSEIGGENKKVEGSDLIEMEDEYLREGLFVLGDLITSKIG
jgi:carboxyl-terminal processing protease